MSFVFVSHAAEDKQERIRPLVLALAMEGVPLWLDRPGYGESHFNFDQGIIRRYGIKGLVAGDDWDLQISAALRDSGAVLACISKALSRERLVWVQELVLGWHYHKLVACVVDELPLEELPGNLGLADLSRIQVERVDTAALQVATSWLLLHDDAAAADLPPRLKPVWEIVRKIASDLALKMGTAAGSQAASPASMEAARKALLKVPIAPLVRAHEIPVEIIQLFADRMTDGDKARRHLSTAMQLVSQCNPEGFTDRQILVGRGEVLSPYQVPAEDYWSSVFIVAGHKSRRTCAALLLAPGAPDGKSLPSGMARVFDEFLSVLEMPTRASQLTS